MRKHLILDIVFQRLAIPGYLITENEYHLVPMGNNVQNKNVQDCPPPSSKFHLHYLSIDCDTQDQIFQKSTTQSRTPALYTY